MIRLSWTTHVIHPHQKETQQTSTSIPIILPDSSDNEIPTSSLLRVKEGSTIVSSICSWS
jgi:hypothetical protein